MHIHIMNVGHSYFIWFLIWSALRIILLAESILRKCHAWLLFPVGSSSWGRNLQDRWRKRSGCGMAASAQRMSRNALRLRSWITDFHDPKIKMRGVARTLLLCYLRGMRNGNVPRWAGLLAIYKVWTMARAQTYQLNLVRVDKASWQ